MTIEADVRLLQLTLPEAPRPLGDYVPTVEAGNVLFVSGMLPMENGAAAFVGGVGQELTTPAAGEPNRKSRMGCKWKASRIGALPNTST